MSISLAALVPGLHEGFMRRKRAQDLERQQYYDATDVLIERSKLIRRAAQCTPYDIVCIDSSGDGPPRFGPMREVYMQQLRERDTLWLAQGGDRATGLP